MHKYVPRLHLVAVSELALLPLALLARQHLCVPFEQTQFIAVTAYQNPRVRLCNTQQQKHPALITGLGAC